MTKSKPATVHRNMDPFLPSALPRDRNKDNHSRRPPAATPFHTDCPPHPPEPVRSVGATPDSSSESGIRRRAPGSDPGLNRTYSSTAVVSAAPAPAAADSRPRFPVDG